MNVQGVPTITALFSANLRKSLFMAAKASGAREKRSSQMNKPSPPPPMMSDTSSVGIRSLGHAPVMARKPRVEYVSISRIPFPSSRAD